jgi:23S rRNA (guanosine2251-2'-O)-methyltransferase
MERMELLYGIHPVLEALRARPADLDRIIVARGARETAGKPDARLEELVAACRAANVRTSFQSRDQLTKLTNTDTHQGVIAYARPRRFLTVEDLIATPAPAGRNRFFLALDGVEDPHNLGAILRTAEAVGIDGVIIPERRAAPVTATVAKSSAGATEHVRIARVPNLVRALELLKAANVWSVGLDERGTTDYDRFDFLPDTVLVLGREGEGLHQLTRRTCDHLLRIPMAGRVASLNVSVAGAVVLYEAARQRRAAFAAALAPATPHAKIEKPRRGLGS